MPVLRNLEQLNDIVPPTWGFLADTPVNVAQGWRTLSIVVSLPTFIRTFIIKSTKTTSLEITTPFFQSRTIYPDFVVYMSSYVYDINFLFLLSFSGR